MRLGVALLAAGSSRRFGEGDKLVAPFRGKRLGEHAANAIPKGRFEGAWIIAQQDDHPCEDEWRRLAFTPILNPQAKRGMGTSVALAAQLASEAGLDALLIALADMPLVPTAHFEALAAAATSRDSIAVSSNGVRMPPAIFGREHFAKLAALNGDRGARDILAQGEVIACPSGWLIDIDTPEARQKYGQGSVSAPKALPKGDMK